MFLDMVICGSEILRFAFDSDYDLDLLMDTTTKRISRLNPSLTDRVLSSYLENNPNQGVRIGALAERGGRKAPVIRVA